MISPQETEVVAVGFRLSDEQPANLLGGADPLAVLRDHLRVQRDSLTKRKSRGRGTEKLVRGLGGGGISCHKGVNSKKRSGGSALRVGVYKMAQERRCNKWARGI